MSTITTKLCRMSPRPRKHLDPKSERFEVRFAIRLRELLDKRKLTAGDFLERVQTSGLNVSAIAVRKWIAGEHMPRPQDAPIIGRVLGLKDYRELWPPSD